MLQSPVTTLAPKAIHDQNGALLVAFGNGDLEAARALMGALSPRVVSQATRMLGNGAEAEDVAQDAFMRLWRAASTWRQGEARVSTWLYRVTSNLCIDRLRTRRGSVGLDDVAEPADSTPGALETMQTAARHRALSNALARLPERQAQAVSLRHLEGLSNPEIAEIMEIGVEAVESLVARGKRALAAALEGRKDDLGYEDD